MKSKQFYNLKAWKILSKVVKLFYANTEGVVFCFTCGKPMMITNKNCHAGHLIKVFDGNSTNFSVAFEFENIGINCYSCNVHQGGRQDLMKMRLEKIHGQKAIDTLYIKKHNFCKLDIVSLKYWEDYYQRIFNNLVAKKGDPWKKGKSISKY